MGNVPLQAALGVEKEVYSVFFLYLVSIKLFRKLLSDIHCKGGRLG